MSELMSLAGVAAAAIVFGYAARTPGRKSFRFPLSLWVRMWQLRNQPVPDDGERLSDTEMHAWLGVMTSYAADPAEGGLDVENEPRKGRRQ